ncbi:Uncharacterised protein [Roseomonas gilardii subsp. rosea]|nr:Uncharacterised protein [Roseomonas gilardii subsp. rosea]
MLKACLTFVMALPFLMAGCACLDGSPSYPRVVATGESTVIDYGPGPRNNIIGGCAVALSGGAGESLTITHFDRSKVQTPPAGMAPVLSRQGENTEIAWVPCCPALWPQYESTGISGVPHYRLQIHCGQVVSRIQTMTRHQLRNLVPV